MKKYFLLIMTSLLFFSCLDDDNENLAYELIPVDSFEVPDSFTFGERHTLKVRYLIQEDCRYFDDVYYEYNGATRIVAINTVRILDRTCTVPPVEFEYDLIVTAAQEEDYVFRFYKGMDDNGNNIFEEVVVPVN